MQLLSVGWRGEKGGLRVVRFGFWGGTARQRFPLLKHTHLTEGQLNEDGTMASKKGYKPETNISSARYYHHNPGRRGKHLGQWGEQQQR